MELNKSYSKFILLFIFGLFFLFPFNVMALSSVSVSCNSSSIYVNESTSCTVYGNSDDVVTSFSANLNVKDIGSSSNLVISSGFDGTAQGTVINLTSTDKTGSFPIVSFTLNASGATGTSTIVLSEVRFNEIFIDGFATTVGVKALPTTPINPDVVKPTPTPTPSTKPTTTPSATPTPSPTPTPVETKSNNALLKSIKLSSGAIEFNKNRKSYDVNVSNSISSIIIKAEAEDTKSTVELPTDLTLKSGLNVKTIKVTAEDGTIVTYTLNITRVEKELSKIATLKSLTIKGYELSFDSSNYVYTIEDVKEDKLDISYVTSDSMAKVKITGNNNLIDDCLVNIQVTAEDGSINNYLINIKKAPNVMSNFAPVLMILILIVLSICVISLLSKRLKNKKKKVQNTNVQVME